MNMPASKALTAVLSALLVPPGCAVAPDAPEGQIVERSRESMGTRLIISVWVSPEAGVVDAIEAVFTEFDRLEDQLSSWREGSDIERLNRAAGRAPVRVGPEVLEVLQMGHQISEWTNGRFDLTFAALSGLWKFDDQNRDETIPDPDTVAQRLPLVDYRDLEVDVGAGTAFLEREGMAVGTGGIGKGYAVDRGREVLEKRGFENFMIQFGGDLYVAGRRGDRAWRLGIQDPRGQPDEIFASIELSDSTFSTSGDYERFFIRDQRRYHHIIDPTNGEPARNSRSVTIVTGSAALADGLSTGVFVLGPDAGMALIERLPGVEGIIVGADNAVRVSSGLEGRLEILSPPTDAL